MLDHKGDGILEIMSELVRVMEQNEEHMKLA